MSSNWMWGVIFLAAAAHALRWIPADAASRSLKMPAVFVILYVLYAAALATAGLAGMIVALIAVEIVLQLSRRRQSRQPPSRRSDVLMRRRR